MTLTGAALGDCERAITVYAGLPALAGGVSEWV
jgi:hypothetical protein